MAEDKGKNEVEDSESVEEEVENSSKEMETRRFDPEAIGQENLSKGKMEMMRFMWMTCMATGFWIMHPM